MSSPETSHTDIVDDQKTFREDRVAEVLANLDDHQQTLVSSLWSQVKEDFSAAFFERFTGETFGAFLSHLADRLADFDSESSYAIDLRAPRDPATPWNTDHTLLTLVSTPLPFVIDSLYELLHTTKVTIHHSFHRHLGISSLELPREVKPPEAEGADRVLLLNLFLEPVSESTFGYLEEELHETLDDLLVAVDDFASMLDRAENLVERLETSPGDLPERNASIEQTVRFLRYLIDDNFVFLGYREATFEGAESEGDVSDARGVLRRHDLDEPLLSTVPVTPDPLETGTGSPVTVAKTNLESRIYRREKLDYVGLKKLDEEGRLIGEYGFVGLFTDRVLTEPAVRIPLLDHKFDQIVEREGLTEHTHTYREMYSTYNSLPKHLLFMTPTDDLARDLHSIITTHEEATFRLLARQHPYQVGLTIMVLMPRQRFSGKVRRTIEEELHRELEPTSIDDRIYLGEAEVARLHYDLQTDRQQPRCGSFEELEQRLNRMTRSWEDRFEEALHDRYEDAEKSEALVHRYMDVLPGEYQVVVDPDFAVQDVQHLERLRTQNEDVLEALRNPPSSDFSHLVIYSRRRLELNDTMPLLANHGLTVHEHYTFELDVEATSLYLHLFPLRGPEGASLPLKEGGDKLLHSIDGVLEGRFRDDTLNRLVLLEGLSPRALNLFRLYKNYFHQLHPGLKLESINRTLIQQHDIARRLHKFFRIRFNPTLEVDDRADRLDQLHQKLSNQIEAITARTQYQIVRNLLNLMQATVRTNYYQPARPEQWVHENLSDHDRRNHKHYLSVKIDASRVEEMPVPRPRHEIFVYSPYMEGIHLRAGDVARGGIRWSDRRDDFRVEVLELMKTQQVKNAVIIPDGAKGGFVIKEEYVDMEDERAQARRQYEVFMHGLLDLTDNRVNGSITQPDDTVCYDEDDPYLVVAADKGTATFSDLANAVARRHDFWMDDAFATGGSSGYDHKELGITARGAWECVKRHFRELGRDPVNEELTVVGIGDMSGDVFGNGLLLSENFKLLGAFNHRHVFLDPDPDPAASFEERRRLFEMEDASWQDYSESVLSSGGGVYDRDASLIDPAEEARERFDLPDGKLEPARVVRAVLTADVDLLWNGGIGTYIKATEQSHAEVGDPQNDAFRVDASDVRVSVIGEGGNLGITQPGRIELDRLDVRLNTDAIDNSGGVDLSDHEVNLKLLFRQLERSGHLERTRRNELLETLADDVTRDVLADNNRQSRVISLERLNDETRLDDYRDLMEHLEASTGLDRMVEDLPDERKLQERRRAGEGLTRPELAVLLSYTKQDLQHRALRSDWPEEWVVDRFTRHYFPEPVLDQFAERLTDHPLRREIALTTMVNRIVDQGGITYLHRLNRETGAGMRNILLWYLSADELAGGDELRDAIDASTDHTTPEGRYRLWRWIQEQLANTVAWMVGGDLEPADPPSFTERFRTGLDEDASRILEQQGARRQERSQNRCERWEKRGFEPSLCRRLEHLVHLVPVLNVLVLHDDAGGTLESLATRYFELGRKLHIHWIMDRILEGSSEVRWDQFAYRNMLTELYRLQFHLTRDLLKQQTDLSELIDEHRDTVDRLADVREEIIREQEVPFSAYQFMIQRLKDLL